MTDHFDQAQRMIRGGNVSADAATIAHAVLALAQALTDTSPACDCSMVSPSGWRPVFDADTTKGDLL